jgi:hypothetical protein
MLNRRDKPTLTFILYLASSPDGSNHACACKPELAAFENTNSVFLVRRKVSPFLSLTGKDYTSAKGSPTENYIMNVKQWKQKCHYFNLEQYECNSCCLQPLTKTSKPSGYKEQKAHHILKHKIQLIVLSDDFLQLHNIWMVQLAE